MSGQKYWFTSRKRMIRVGDAGVEYNASVYHAEDWLGRLGPADVEHLRGLPFRRLARIPPPKRGGLPIGHELRILRRFLAGGTSSLDPSALTAAYLASVGARERFLFRAFVAREALPAAAWTDELGPIAGDWQRRGLLAGDGGALRSRFAVVPIGDDVYVVDPQDASFAGKVHIGQDSLNLLEFLSQRIGAPAGRRVLDVGTGSGVLLVSWARTARAAVAVELNPRAVELARFNAAVNDVTCTVTGGDVFALAPTLGEFDVVVWNAPFMFLPDAERELKLDGFGGELGIGITLEFVERLPALLAADGVAVVLTSSPVIEGVDRLGAELAEVVPRLALDVHATTVQAFWIPRLAAFHARHGITRFDSVVLELRRGRGRLTRERPPVGRRVTDAVRGLLYRGRSGVR
jgi:SAM-dependent methyltransferase